MHKLLIVDDEPMIVDMLEAYLQLQGYETVSAFCGEDGLLLIKLEQPELVILDLMLPDIEGFEVCRTLRTKPEYAPYAGLPILILSARAESESRVRAQEAGANAYMAKPVRFPELLSELKRLLAGSPQSQAL